jgi:hypothetical protein
MKWRCWQCSPDDGCELVDLTGGTKEMMVNLPKYCPIDGEEARWKEVPDETVS